MPIAGNRRAIMGGGTGARGIKFDPSAYFSYNDTAIDTDEALDNSETGIDCDADATTAIPVGSIIKIDTEYMFVTATGTTLTVVRPSPVAHDTNADIYKRVDNCVLWLPGQDDAYSGTIRDRSGQNNNGTITAAIWAKTGRGLWYLDFDGTDDYISFGNPAFTTNQQGAIEMWVLPVDGNLGAVFSFSKLSTTFVDEFVLKVDMEAARNRLEFVVFNNGVNTHVLRTAAILTAGVWVHVVLGSDGSANYMTINGVNQSIIETVGTADGVWFGDLVTDADLVVMGALPRSNSYIVDYLGGIALTRIYSANLPTATALAHYQQERHLFGV